MDDQNLFVLFNDAFNEKFKNIYDIVIKSVSILI